MRLDNYDIEKQYTAKVIASTLITPEESEEEVRELELEIKDYDFVHKVGQSVGVLAPGNDDLGYAHHFRLYSIANPPKKAEQGNPSIIICVKRCSYIDNYSGEKFKGVASNYLCDRRPDDQLTIAGPYGLPFEVPDDKDSDLLLIGLGTGIAPFRAFVKYIYQCVGGWKGKIRLFYGAKTGLEMLYMNDKRDDFANYYDEETFAAFKALSPRPHWADPIALDRVLGEREKEVWIMICNPKTHIYVAGLETISNMLDRAFSKMAGSKAKWDRRKSELIAGKRWVELIY